MELMLDMQKRFEEKLEALRAENSAIKVQLNGRKNNLEKAENPAKSKKEGESR